MAETGGEPFKPADVIVVGSVNQDLVVEADAFPAPGETVHGRRLRGSTGGKGANQAVATALAGASCAMVARVGDDAAGGQALRVLGQRGVDTSMVARVAAEPTGTALITVAADDNTIVVVAGANGAWDADWPDPLTSRALGTADIVLAQLEVPLSVVERAAAATRGRFVLNAAPAIPLPDSLLQRCAVLVVNEHELAVVGGAQDGALAQVHELLLGRGVGAVVTTLGAKGAVVTDRSGTQEVASPPAEVVDTTGAGDAFTGVLCARLAAGASLPEAVRWAAAAGSWAVRAPGTHDSYPDLATLRRLAHEDVA